MHETSTLFHSPAHWSHAQKILFRFAFLFFGLLIFPFPLDNIPGVDTLTQYYASFIQYLSIFTGKLFFSLTEEINTEPNGSGDTTIIYLQYFLVLLLSVAATLIWSVLDKRRPSYNTALHWFLGYLRIFLILNMWSYGFAKLFVSQFPYPSLQRLVQPIGECSPMGLAWTFMGYSPGYNMFTGALEVLAGTLLIFRATRLSGALLAMAVMINVMAMNFCYDIPVKLFSTQLVLMSVLLLVPDRKKLINTLLLNKATEANAKFYLIQRKKLRITLNVLLYVFLGIILTFQVWNELSYDDSENRSPLYGIYEVKTFVKNGDTLPPLTTDSVRWNRIIAEYKNVLFTQTMNKNKYYNRISIDTILKKGKMNNFIDTNLVFNFSYSIPDRKTFNMKGIYGKDTLDIQCDRIEQDSFRLVKRGFHWINEYPYNR